MFKNKAPLGIVEALKKESSAIMDLFTSTITKLQVMNTKITVAQTAKTERIKSLNREVTQHEADHKELESQLNANQATINKLREFTPQHTDVTESNG